MRMVVGEGEGESAGEEAKDLYLPYFRPLPLNH